MLSPLLTRASLCVFVLCILNEDRRRGGGRVHADVIAESDVEGRLFRHPPHKTLGGDEDVVSSNTVGTIMMNALKDEVVEATQGIAEGGGIRATPRFRLKDEALEHEILVPPADQEASVNPPPPCPKNARYSFCAMDAKCVETCEDRLTGGTTRVRACNAMCYQRCECIPDFILLEGYCVSQAACEKIMEAKTPGRRREAIEDALDGYDPNTDRLYPPSLPGGGLPTPSPSPAGTNKPPLPPHVPPTPKPTAQGMGTTAQHMISDVADNVEGLLEAVTGGLWPGGGGGKDRQAGVDLVGTDAAAAGGSSSGGASSPSASSIGVQPDAAGGGRGQGRVKVGPVTVTVDIDPEDLNHMVYVSGKEEVVEVQEGVGR